MDRLTSELNIYLDHNKKETIMKRQEIGERIEALIIWMQIKKQDFINGDINEEQFANCLDYADKVFEDIEAEIAVLNLIESVCLN